MASNQYANHIVIGGVTKLDLRADTVTVAVLAQGYTAHDASGAPVTGTLASGDAMGYGTGDATRPIVGIGQASYMVI